MSNGQSIDLEYEEKERIFKVTCITKKAEEWAKHYIRNDRLRETKMGFITFTVPAANWRGVSNSISEFGLNLTRRTTGDKR